MATITGVSRGWGALAARERPSYRRLPSQSSQDQPARVAHSRYRQAAVQQELASAREQPIYLPRLLGGSGARLEATPQSAGL